MNLPKESAQGICPITINQVDEWAAVPYIQSRRRRKAISVDTLCKKYFDNREKVRYNRYNF